MITACAGVTNKPASPWHPGGRVIQSGIESDFLGAQELLLQFSQQRHLIAGMALARSEHTGQRQIKVLNRVLDGFEGKPTSSKYAKLVNCSQDTAYRDILDLIERGALCKDAGGGRSTSYSLVR